MSTRSYQACTVCISGNWDVIVRPQETLDISALTTWICSCSSCDFTHACVINKILFISIIKILTSTWALWRKIRKTEQHQSSTSLKIQEKLMHQKQKGCLKNVDDKIYQLCTLSYSISKTSLVLCMYVEILSHHHSWIAIEIINLQKSLWEIPYGITIMNYHMELPHNMFLDWGHLTVLWE